MVTEFDGWWVNLAAAWIVYLWKLTVRRNVNAMLWLWYSETEATKRKWFGQLILRNQVKLAKTMKYTHTHASLWLGKQKLINRASEIGSSDVEQTKYMLIKLMRNNWTRNCPFEIEDYTKCSVSMSNVILIEFQSLLKKVVRPVAFIYVRVRAGQKMKTKLLWLQVNEWWMKYYCRLLSSWKQSWGGYHFWPPAVCKGEGGRGSLIAHV